MQPELLQNLFERAMSEELGLVVECNNPKGLQIKLANYRKDNGLDEFRDILVTIPSIPDHIILVKKSVELHDV